jgi:hypothetical protein
MLIKILNLSEKYDNLIHMNLNIHICEKMVQ